MKKFVIANWKMNPASPRDAMRLAHFVGRGVKKVKNINVVLAPPFIYLPLLRHTPYAIRRTFQLGAQDVFYEKAGAYTGEVSPLQLKAYGAKLVIVGHSERRALGETNETVQKKLKA